ncbi:hypothetical protein FB567DRAFT_445410 [Paraphoma chrysanthemicola]|uniref:Uncharacterized protein n=1 Tax=Paraphoma chrysanthemicola TaxID=798071 RepID=A0A8K0R2M9_9PLEO|nr:hypothetical protein FB567DRAFT_445410 [Paraphoma chrysanthemicola]
MVEDDRGRRKKTSRYGLGPRTPPANLPFPVEAKLTAYELLAFLPNVVHCADVIYRFVSNGATRHAIWVIVNTARDLPDEWHANCCGTYMYKAMKAAGYDGWTVTTHDNWHAARKSTWDEANMNVGGFRTPNEVRGLVALTESIPFATLAADVRRMPQGNDALDLTRMVQHCVQHPEEQWLYPRDYQRLLKHIGGPAPISHEHLDRKTFGRWDTKSAPPPREWTAQEIEAATHYKETMKKSKRESSTRLATPDPGRHSRQSTPSHTQRKSKRQIRRNTRLEEIEIDELEWEYEVSQPQMETYTRSPADYVKPPIDVKVPEDVAVALVFAAERAVGEKDAFSAYAFGGPRHREPFRMLHHIGQPHPADISGWAENLRWAFEQRACFWHAVETEGWNESPSHMELITAARQTQNWASDELFENLPEAEDA